MPDFSPSPPSADLTPRQSDMMMMSPSRRYDTAHDPTDPTGGSLMGTPAPGAPPARSFMPRHGRREPIAAAPSTSWFRPLDAVAGVLRAMGVTGSAAADMPADPGAVAAASAAPELGSDEEE